ncbi:MAG TPA: hypothetical protein VKT77_11125 [Chthonomonadaceae bacterium]|nr:hypothetical protein [Chthonomonadaceae bacterium]
MQSGSRTAILAAAFIACSVVCAQAQARPVVRLLMGDCQPLATESAPASHPELAEYVRAIVVRQLARPRRRGPVEYGFIDPTGDSAAWHRGALPGPAPLGATEADRISAWRPWIDASKADAIVEVRYAAGTAAKGAVRAGVELQFADVAALAPVVHAIAYRSESDLRTALRKAAEAAVSKCLAERLVEGTIVRRVGRTIILDIGTKDGVHVGDEFAVIGLVDGKGTVVGRIKAARVYPHDLEAEVLNDNVEIATGSRCTRIWFPSIHVRRNYEP